VPNRTKSGLSVLSSSSFARPSESGKGPTMCATGVPSGTPGVCCSGARKLSRRHQLASVCSTEAIECSVRCMSVPNWALHGNNSSDMHVCPRNNGKDSLKWALLPEFSPPLQQTSRPSSACVVEAWPVTVVLDQRHHPESRCAPSSQEH
jgi:hypothetical protein